VGVMPPNTERNFEKVYCFECDMLVSEYSTIFFLEKEYGLPRYGAICKKCLKKANNRKIVVLTNDDVVLYSGKVVKDALRAFKRNRSKL
jgi:peptidoglycan/xylan/chitin deacetylase (PgdA/CDA1 family)